MITLLANLLSALNSDDNPAQIALAVVLAAFLGITPLMSPHNILIIFIVLVVRSNLTMFFLGLSLFTLMAYLLDPLSHLLGLAILNADALSPLWTSLYQNSFWRFMAYNNTLVIGSLTLVTLLSLPLFFTCRWLVIKYRDNFMQWINKTRFMTWLQGSRLYITYNAIKN